MIAWCGWEVIPVFNCIDPIHMFDLSLHELLTKTCTHICKYGPGQMRHMTCRFNCLYVNQKDWSTMKYK